MKCSYSVMLVGLRPHSGVADESGIEDFATALSVAAAFMQLHRKNVVAGSILDITDQMGTLCIAFEWADRAWRAVDQHDARTRHYRNNLDIPVDELGLSARPLNVLRPYLYKPQWVIEYVGDLIQFDEKRLRAMRGMGRESLAEIKLKLGELGLSLGTVIDGWTRPTTALPPER